MNSGRTVSVLHDVDRQAGEIIRRAVGRLPAATAVTRATTDLGSMFMVVGASAVLLMRGRRRRALEVAAAGALGWTVAQRVKHAFDRLRPYQAEDTVRLIPEPTGSSMPSGHAAVVAGVASVLAADSCRRRRWVWAVVAAWVPLTRIHLGVHYPTDTVVGLGLGRILGTVVLRLSDRLFAR